MKNLKAAQKLDYLCLLNRFAFQTDFIVHCEYRYRCLLIYVSIYIKVDSFRFFKNKLFFLIESNKLLLKYASNKLDN